MSLRDELIEAFELVGLGEIEWMMAGNLVDAVAQTLDAHGLQIVLSTEISENMMDIGAYMLGEECEGLNEEAE